MNEISESLSSPARLWLRASHASQCHQRGSLAMASTRGPKPQAALAALTYWPLLATPSALRGSRGWGSLGCLWGCSSSQCGLQLPQCMLLAGPGSGSSSQGLGSILRPTQQPQLNSGFFVEPLHAARGNCEHSLTLVGCRHFSPPTSARGSPRPQKGSGPPLSSRQGRAAW